MRITARRVLIALPLVAAAIPITFFTFLYGLGRSLVPQPEPSTAPIPALMSEALWAVAGGGREPELRPLNPIGLFRYVTCAEEAQHMEEPQGRDERQAECRKHLPAMQLREHLANQHVRDQQLDRNSFRGGAASFSTMLGFSNSWTKDEFLRTVADRAQFGNGWRGAGVAARGYFGRDVAALTLPQTALIAARAGADGPDPWCDPEGSAKARNRVLTGMRDNGVISEADYLSATNASLELSPSPPDHKPCAGSP
jgi:hypothetical protein